jgi:aminoglycoside phosphotransferase (APT) family kinase protein
VTNDALVEQLAGVLGGARVKDLVRLSGGASRETWRFVIGNGGTELTRILQRQRAGSDRNVGTEVAVLQAAKRAGVPVPDVVAWSDAPDQLGAPFMVLSHVVGETIARKIQRDDRYAPARAVLPSQLGDALARLHAIAPGSVPGVVEVDQLAQYRATLDLTGQPHPALELAFRWLEANRPPMTQRVVLHGDFRLGNVIVDDAGLAAVLDWELTHLGDPMEDLGWLCVKAWRFGGVPPVAGLGPYEALFDAYEARSGTAVDPDVVRWWETLGTLKWGIMCIMQATAHLTGASRSHELAAIGRRVCENEHDLFLLLP